ncbi:putative spermatogenesis-associated protein 31C1 isoform X1 [Eptesicus fuscus]|uniref:putative spermatogenesis-associated protein 31C1 isoform X1 n=1 Tax=Eptesicus fuscus TaxID=29078 RepID=UPI002403F761|nr:putative spermatogenesis-associated protein 31C1 isoform X1 [Eptesicus fuscus]
MIQIMEDFLCPLKSAIATWQSSSLRWVIDTIFGIVCGALLFLVLVLLLDRDQSLPLPREHRNTRKHSVEPRRRSCRKKNGALKACRECLQDLEKARGLIHLLGSHLGRPPEQCGFRQRSCQDPSGEVCKAAPAGANRPCGEPVEDAAPTMSPLASLAPVTECPLPLASTLSPGPTTTSVSLHSHSSWSASQLPEPFLPLDDLSPQPLALSRSSSLPPDSGAHPPPPTASSASPPPASTLTLPQCDSVALTLGPIPQSSCPHTPQSASPTPAVSGLGHSRSPISALSWWQAATKTLCLSASSQYKSQQEHLSHHPPEASFQEDPTDRQAEADEQNLLEIHITKIINVKILKKNEKDALYPKQMNPNYHLHSLGNTWKSLGAEQDTTTPQPLWSMKDEQEQLHSPLQLYSQLFWGLPSLHSESLEATARTSKGSSTLQPPPFLFNGISNTCPVQLQATAPPLLSHSQPMSHLEFPSPPLLPTMLQLQPPPLAQVQTRSSLPTPPPSSPPQIRSCGVSCPTAQNEPQFLIPIEIQHPERPLLQKQVESGWDLSSVVRRSQEVFSVFTSNLPKDSILPENFPIIPEPRKQLESHLQNWHMQQCWELSPKIQEPPKLGQHQSELPGPCQAKDKHEPSQPSSLTGESSNDAQNLGLRLSHDTGKVPKDPSRGSESSLVTFQRVDSEESESDVMLLRRDSGSDLLRNLDRNLENTLKGHLGSKLGQMSKSLMSVHGPWLAVSHSSAKADTHMETKNLGILKDWEPCMNASHRVFFLDTDIQKVLEAHITKFWVKHRWGLPLKVLKPMSLIKLKRAQASPILQFPLPPSSTCVSGAYSIVKFVEFPGKPSQACPGEKVKTEDSVPTLARSLLAPSRVCEEMQGALGGTPPGVDHGPSKASLTRQEGRPPSQSLTLTWKSKTAEWAERDSLDLSPSSAMARNEPRGKGRGGASQEPFNGVAMTVMNLISQSLRTKEVKETMEANVSPALQPELGTNVQTTSQNINAHLKSVESPGTNNDSLVPRTSFLQEPGEPCLNKEVINELKSEVQVPSENQPQDCATHMPLATDNLASQVHHHHSQRVPPGVRLASHVLCGLKTPQRSSQGKQEPRISYMQDSWKNQRQMFVPTYKREDIPGKHAEGPEKLGTSQAIQMSPSAKASETVDSVERQYPHLGPEKKQGPPESFFRQRMRLFFQGIFPNKKLKGQDALLDYKLNSVTAQSQGPVKGISIMGSKIPEAQTLITTVGQILEEKIHQGLRTTALNEHKQEPQTPVCGYFCYHRLPVYPEKGRVMSHTACSHQANSNQSCSTREGQVRQTESLKSIKFNDEPLSLSRLTFLASKTSLSSVRSCQHGPKGPGALGHHQHCPRHCLFRVGVLSG